jgi:hypothetical protein
MVVPLKVNNKIQILYLCVLIRNPEKDVYWKSITAPVLECSLPYDLTKTVSPFCRSITAMLLPDAYQIPVYNYNPDKYTYKWLRISKESKKSLKMPKG